MSNINSLWRSYLAGEGYSLADVNNMIKRALEAETGETGDINSLWMKYLSAQGYTDGDINSRMMQWLGAKGYSGDINSRLRQALQAGDIFAAAAACTITLTGDLAAVFGGQPLDISGQTVSKTVPASPADLYVAASGFSPVSWSGWRGVAYQASTFSTVETSRHDITLIDSTYTTTVRLVQLSSGGWVLSINSSSPEAFALGPFEKVGVRVDGATGDVEVFIGADVRTKSDYPALGGLFAGKSVAVGAVLGYTGGASLTAGDTYSAQIYTAAADLTDVGFPAGTLDWCGNSIA